MSFKFATAAIVAAMISGPLAGAVVVENQGSPKEETVGGEHNILRAPAAAGRNGVSRKRYPGGADEDDLQVQSTLPIPARNYDGTSTTAAMVSDSLDSESPPPPPAND